MSRVSYMSVGHGDNGAHAILFAIDKSGNLESHIVDSYEEYEQGETLLGAGRGLTHFDVFDMDEYVLQGRVCRHSKRASLVPVHGRYDERKLEYAARRVAKQFGVTVEVFQYNNGWLCQVI